MRQPEQHESDPKSRSDDASSLTKDKAAFPTICGPGCSCGTPVKTPKWKILIMMVVVSVVIIALIYKEMI